MAIFLIILIMAGCSEKTEETSEDVFLEIDEDLLERQEQHEEGTIWLMDYAYETGFTLMSPEQDHMETDTYLEVKGVIEEEEKINDSHLLIEVLSEKVIHEEMNTAFYHYVPLKDNGEFNKELALHHGEGEYEIRIRLPGKDPEDLNNYYPVAYFHVYNTNAEIKREVEYSKFAINTGITLSRPASGMVKAEETISVKGEVPDKDSGDAVIVQVEHNDESRQVMLPVRDGKFSGDVPLYFGEALHFIRIQAMNVEKGVFYDAASFYADNTSAEDFVETEYFPSYARHGVTLEEPSMTSERLHESTRYRIAGEIDPSVAGTEKISSILVTTTKGDNEELEAGYLVNVEDYKFDDEIFFRFGSGNYDILINVPDIEKEELSIADFKAIKKISLQVNGIEDERSLLPSRGIESDHPLIMNKAYEITEGIENEREAAKAVYEFTASNLSYNVQKRREDVFELEDSALKTLETGSGGGLEYAFLATALLRAAGMEANYIEGEVNHRRHAWVEVKVDGKWLTMDPALGAGTINEEGEFLPAYTEEYFDPDPEVFKETHSRGGVLY
ncbi:transglutaminase-like domain-containing protein [Salipaludibacillus aurantiacus]|uniref:transglutaminase-like domain-containing protein n=1 Tax=Salipaludibacillus aurantiacus TaxID=1601833 RepID=UPI0015A50DA3|nr:transglutaminase-like domain-containing protein [Salipaludibacillus aurantiacus]